MPKLVRDLRAKARPRAEKQQQEESGAKGGPHKGSCPSWLKSRVYKGGRPSGNEEGLAELQEVIIRHSPVGTAVFDNRGRLRISNEAFAEALGADPDTMIEDIDAVAEFIEGVSMAERFWDAMEGGTAVEEEITLEVSDSEQMTLRMLFRPVSLPSGIDWCVCYLELVPEAERPSGQLWDYQNYVAMLAASSADAIVGLDPDGFIKYWNQGAQALFGFTEDEVVGQSVLKLVPEDLRREAKLVLKVVRERGVYKNFDTHRLNKRGKRVPVTMTISAVRDEDGNFMGTAAMCQDLRLAKDLHEKALEAEKLNAVLQMAVSVYHRINDPLAVICANAQLLVHLLGPDNGQEAKKLTSILDAAKRISTVLDDLTRLTGVEPRMASSDEDEDSAA